MRNYATQNEMCHYQQTTTIIENFTTERNYQENFLTDGFLNLPSPINSTFRVAGTMS